MTQAQPWLRLYDFCIDGVAWRPRLLVALLCRSPARDRVLSLVPVRGEPDYEAKRDAFVYRCLETTESPVDSRYVQEADLILGTDWERIDALAWVRLTQDLGDRAQYHFGYRFTRWSLPFADRVWLMLVYAVLGDKESSDWLTAVLISVRHDGFYGGDRWDALPLGQRLACARWASVKAADVPVKPYYSTLLALVDHHDPPPMCCVCLCETPRIIFDTCGHLCVCDDCWTRLLKASSEVQCPLCRQTVGRTRRVSYRHKPTPVMSFEEGVSEYLLEMKRQKSPSPLMVALQAPQGATPSTEDIAATYAHPHRSSSASTHRPAVPREHRAPDHHESSSLPPPQFYAFRRPWSPGFFTSKRDSPFWTNNQVGGLQHRLDATHPNEATDAALLQSIEETLDRMMRMNETTAHPSHRSPLFGSALRRYGDEAVTSTHPLYQERAAPQTDLTTTSDTARRVGDRSNTKARRRHTTGTSLDEVINIPGSDSCVP
ncbi:Ring domain protein [Mollivirus kamchatka]|nr:Ring domain protein [Mollivirus kamchatka]